MAKTKISEFNSNPALNTDIDSINISEGCAPSGINDAIRELMSQLKDWQAGTSNDPMVIGSSGSLTLNQGTANGVAYLNGSKVVTSGSALVFDGTNLGLGVTPSAWSTLVPALQLGGGGSFISGRSTNPEVYVGANAYFNGSNYIYKTSNVATLYAQDTGSHNWYRAASGTAGNAITFTQAMTLSADGNLLVGTTTTRSRITALGTTATSPTLGTATGTALFCPNDNAYGTMFGSSNTGDGWIQQQRVDGTATAYNLILQPSGGNLLVGTTSGQNSKFVSDGGSGTALWGKCSTSSSATNVIWNSATSGDNQLIYLYTDTAPFLRGSIVYNRAGGIVVYSTTSDYRSKDIFGPVTDSGSVIDSVPVYMGKMKGATQERPMFIAHETPSYAHTGEKDAVDADGNPVYQQMDASALIPVMWAEIQSLRQRLAAANL